MGNAARHLDYGETFPEQFGKVVPMTVVRNEEI